MNRERAMFRWIAGRDAAPRRSPPACSGGNCAAERGADSAARCPYQKRFLEIVVTLWLGSLVFFPAETQSADVAVFAAASLTDALKEIAADYQKQSGDKIFFNFGASSILARQIEEGAPADIFFSADEAWMDALEKKSLILAGTRLSRLSNSLVIIVAADSLLKIRSPADLAGSAVKQIALADPRAVPAGIYAREYLQKLHLWAQIEPKVVPTDNVRAVLAAVESGNVEAGMVYKTDAAISGKVKVAFEVPVANGPAISYPMAVVKDSGQPDAAGKFLRYLESDEAGRVFEKFGFIVREPSQEKAGATPIEPTPPGNSHEWQIVWFTAWVSALSTLIILPFGLAVAWLLARRRCPGKSLVETVVTLPLVMPPVATGLILLKLLERNSAIGGFFYRTLGLDIAFTWRAVLVALAVMSFPLLVRAARVAFEEVNPRLEQIARTLGAGNARVFLTVTLPLAARGVVGGMLLAFARALGEFGATIMVAGNIPGKTSTLSLSIFQSFNLHRDAQAFRLLGVSVALAFLAVWTSEIVVRRAARRK